MKSLGIRVLLVLPYLLVILFLGGLVGILTYNNGKESVDTLAEKISSEVSARIQANLIDFLETPQQINKINEEFLGSENIDITSIKEMQFHFWNQIQVFESVSSIYFGSLDGGLVGSGREGADGSLYLTHTDDLKSGDFKKSSVDDDGNQVEVLVSVPSFDARTRSWYQEAIMRNDATWSDVYILFTGQDLAVAASRPVYDSSGDLLGITSVDIFVSHLSNFLSTIDISENGQSFIFEPSGFLIADSTGDLQLKTLEDGTTRIPLNESSNSIIQNAGSYILSEYGNFNEVKTHQVIEYDLNGEHYHLQLAPVQDEFGIEFLIGVVIPESDFSGHVRENARNSTIAVLFSILLLITINFIVSRQITTPLEALMDFSRSISRGDWNLPRIPKGQVKEIDKLSDSFSKMAHQLETTLENLQESETRYRTLVENVPLGVYRTTPKEPGTLITFNKAFQEILGIPDEEKSNSSIEKFYVNNEDRYTAIEEVLNTGGVRNKEILFKKLDGTEFWGSITSSGVRDPEGKLIYLDGVLEDISERKAYQEQLQYLATHDTLTGLPNRALLEDRLGHAIEKATRYESLVGVIFMDLDGFKAVNDAYGHKEGDKLLQEVARRLSTNIRKSDTVARFGGDEFVIILDDIKNLEDLLLVAEKTIDVFQSPFNIGDSEVFISSSLGISVFPDDSYIVDVLLQNADTAMYRAKASGNDQYQFYSSNMKEEVRKRFKLSMELRDSMKNNELQVYYQPQVNAITGEIVGIEALLRWDHPERGLISPGEFIALAEETGLIKKIGEWVLRTSCKDIKRWEDMGLKPVQLSMNLSEKELNRKNLVKVIQEILETTKVDPGKLEFELTENIVFQNFNKSLPILEGIKKLGVKLAVDDFGTGYSTLSQLAHFDFDTLKIDQRYAPSVTTSKKDAAIVEGIITISNNLGMQVVVEGVENLEQLDFYLKQNAPTIQGWLFSKAVSSQEMESLLKKGTIKIE